VLTVVEPKADRRSALRVSMVIIKQLLFSVLLAAGGPQAREANRRVRRAAG
jgi:hypothetical protein